MNQNDAVATGQPVEFAFDAAAAPKPSKVGMAYLKFLIGALVAFMLSIVGKIESGDHTNSTAGHVILALALVSLVYAVFELGRGVIGGRAKR
jgi:hypothetical protein